MLFFNLCGFMERMQCYVDVDCVDYGILFSMVEGVIMIVYIFVVWLFFGCVEIVFRFWFGVCMIFLYQFVEVFGCDGMLQMVCSVVVVFVEVLGVFYIVIDVICVFFDGEGFDIYVQYYCLFFYCCWFGWMGFVFELVLYCYFFEVVVVYVVMGCGMIIVFVEGCLDLCNRVYLCQVYEVEVWMVQLGLLDVIDVILLD